MKEAEERPPGNTFGPSEEQRESGPGKPSCLKDSPNKAAERKNEPFLFKGRRNFPFCRFKPTTDAEAPFQGKGKEAEKKRKALLPLPRGLSRGPSEAPSPSQEKTPLFD